MSDKTIEVKNLKTMFNTDRGSVIVVNDVSFNIKKGEILGLVGESGSGKSVTSLSIMRLIPNPPGKIIGGEVIFKGEDLLSKTEEEMRKIRGDKISMIFQEPMTSLNPVFRISNQLIEAYVTHNNISKKEALKKSIELLRLVGIPSPERRINDYPHQFSGGMRQRVMIAMALAGDPELLIADEPTTALDVTIQAQILDLLKDINKKFGTSILLVTHDMGVIAQMCDKVCVMYAGKIMETADVESIFFNPAHPYTKALLNSIPTLDNEKEKLNVIEGSMPNPFSMPVGCRFADRCNYSTEICYNKAPQETLINKNHSVYCWHILNKSGSNVNE
ncbi:MAG: ABC transporter ATP-binding protein [Clostridiales bacterium]|nr:ABC transporter ATP-binding protein [Clostridiales bacterium]